MLNNLKYCELAFKSVCKNTLMRKQKKNFLKKKKKTKTFVRKLKTNELRTN